MITIKRVKKVIKNFISANCDYYNLSKYIKSNKERERLLMKPELQDSTRLERYGYKVYSQNDEDGIIAEIFNRIGTTSKFFVEFGVETGIENNTLYLLLQNWSGVWIEGNHNYFSVINKKFHNYISRKKLTIKNAIINCDNINELLTETGCTQNFSKMEAFTPPPPSLSVDLLSIDIDGNDYHVFSAITVIKPRVVVIEYNAKFPPPVRWIMKYNPEYTWDGSDQQGMSLKALEDLAQEKGYQLVGTNITGSNAFLVRSDLVGNFFTIPSTAENLYNPPRYYLKFFSGHPIKNAPI